MADRNYEHGLLLAKIETTEGADAAPAVADCVRMFESFDANADESFARTRDKIVTPGQQLEGWRDLRPFGHKSEWSNSFEVRGTKDGGPFTLANFAELSAYFAALGLSSTIVVGTSCTIRPAATALQSITEYKYQDGLLFKLLGARARRAVFTLEPGFPLMAEIARVGLWEAPTSVAMPTAGLSFGFAEPSVAVNANLSLDGYLAGIIGKFSWTIENTLQDQRGSVNAPDGLAPPRIRGRDFTWECTLEEPLLTEKDFELLRRNRTPFAIGWGITGGSAYQTHAFSAPGAQLRRVARSNMNGTPGITLSGILRPTSIGAGDTFTHTIS